MTDESNPEPSAEAKSIGWPILHFSQANPEGVGQENVPALLRRIADSVEQLGDVNVMDITFHTELDDEVRWRPSMTVYFSKSDE